MTRFTLVLLMVFSSLGAFAGTASGTVTVNGKSFEMKHVYAMQIEDWTDKTQSAALVLVTDKPVPQKLLVEDLDTFALRDAGVNGIKFEFYSGGSNYAMNMVGDEIAVGLSVSGTFDKEQFTELTDTHLSGKFVQDKAIGDTKFSYDLQLDTDIAPRVVKAEPTAADAEAAQKAESVKAYFAFYEVLKAGDLKAIRAMVAPERAAQMDQPDFKETLAFIQSMMPTDVKALKATEGEDSAEILLSGKDSGEDRVGTVLMLKRNGKWIVEKESWKSK